MRRNRTWEMEGTDAFVGEFGGSLGISFSFERRMACDDTEHGRWRGKDAFGGKCGMLGVLNKWSKKRGVYLGH